MACGWPRCLGFPTNQILRSPAGGAAGGVIIATRLGAAIPCCRMRSTDSSPRLPIAPVLPSVPSCSRRGALAAVSRLPLSRWSVWPCLPRSGCGAAVGFRQMSPPLCDLPEGFFKPPARLDWSLLSPVIQTDRHRTACKGVLSSDLSRCRPPTKQPPVTLPLTHLSTAHPSITALARGQRRARSHLVGSFPPSYLKTPPVLIPFGGHSALLTVPTLREAVGSLLRDRCALVGP